MTSKSTADFNQLYQVVIGPELCTRCGTCAGACPEQVIGFDADNFPELTGHCVACNICNSVCPGAEVDFPALSKQVFGVDYDPKNLQGFVENMYVAHSVDDEIREAGTSGGVVTRLLMHLLQSGKIDGAIVVAPDSRQPYLAKGALATTPAEMVAASKSKYQITPSMEVFQLLRKSTGRYAVVGLPCQVHGLRKLKNVDATLSKKIYCILGLFCHCNLESEAVKDSLEVHGIKPENVLRFDYRGGAWPGRFIVAKKDGNVTPLFSQNIRTLITVFFTLYGAKRCQVCYDALADYADLSFGDFWATDYAGEFSDLERCTLIYQRTKIGAEILDGAEGDVSLKTHKLPADRASRRILNMARGKKQKCRAQILHQSGKGEDTPDYHFDINKMSAMEGDSRLKFRIYNWRGRIPYRKTFLKLYASPLGRLVGFWLKLRKKQIPNQHKN